MLLHVQFCVPLGLSPFPSPGPIAEPFPLFNPRPSPSLFHESRYAIPPFPDKSDGRAVIQFTPSLLLTTSDFFPLRYESGRTKVRLDSDPDRLEQRQKSATTWSHVSPARRKWLLALFLFLFPLFWLHSGFNISAMGGKESTFAPLFLL